MVKIAMQSISCWSQ